MKILTLDNGMKLITHQKNNTELAVLNILYKTGAIHETQNKTGLAHLLEHMMFEGSSNYNNFDYTLQDALGENNAFTTQEYTNYYEILPIENLDVALDLEVDRLQHLTLNRKKFATQKSIVLEEYKETSINPPFSDNWHHLLKLAFKNSNYEWPVIGSTIQDVASLERKDIKSFYNAYYNPCNAIVCVVSHLDEEEMLNRLKLKFNSIENKKDSVHVTANNTAKKHISKFKLLKRKNIHASAFYIAFHIPDFGTKEYFICDMISDFISNGESSVLYYNFIKKHQYCTEISSYITDNKYNNLLIIEGKLNESIDFHKFKEKLETIFKEIFDSFNAKTIEMLKNKSEGFFIFNNYNLTNLAQNLSFYTYCNIEQPMLTIPKIYNHITEEEFKETFSTYIKMENTIELLYIKS